MEAQTRTYGGLHGSSGNEWHPCRWGNSVRLFSPDHKTDTPRAWAPSRRYRRQTIETLEVVLPTSHVLGHRATSAAERKHTTSAN